MKLSLSLTTKSLLINTEMSNFQFLALKQLICLLSQLRVLSELRYSVVRTKSSSMKLPHFDSPWQQVNVVLTFDLIYSFLINDEVKGRNVGGNN